MNKPKISLIVAMSENHVIGNKGEIPWKIPGEQKRFREITTPHPLIMGRKTFESIGRLLPDRPNIIITRDTGFKVNGGHVVHSIDEAIVKAREVESERIEKNSHPGEATTSIGSSLKEDSIASPGTVQYLASLQNDGEGEIFIIGGGKVFEEGIKVADKLYLTIVHQEFEGDAFFPEYPQFSKEIHREDKEVGGYRFTYLDLVRG